MSQSGTRDLPTDTPVSGGHGDEAEGGAPPGGDSREHFIPVRKSDLIRILSASPLLPEDRREPFANLCRLIDATIHYQFHEHLELLKDCYAPCDPDAATLRLSGDHCDTEKSIDLLFERFDELLGKANYVHLERAQIETAIGAASDWGVRLDVDLDLFQRLEVYARGDTIGRRTRRRWRNLYRREEVDVPIYRQLAVIFRLRLHERLEPDVLPETVYIKLFKNIPKQDLDMLLPGSRVKMTIADQSRILLPTVSGALFSLYKVIKLLAFASLYGMFVLLAAIAGTFGYGIKSFLGYLRTKDKYQHHLTKSLYYQNLDNNAGVLFRLLNEAEEQEFRETIIAYFLLWRQAPVSGWTCREIDLAAESLLEDVAQVRIDFEVEDAIAKLDRFGLAKRVEQDRWVALPIESGLQHLDALWDRYFEFSGSTRGS